MTVEMLEIVDENDNVIGTAPRSEIHAKGLLHREVNVMFITPKGDLIFQRRSKTKDVYPDLLDAAAGGHVDTGHSYDHTAFKETQEETGLTIQPEELHFITKLRVDEPDTVKNVRNCAFRAIYGYVFDGSLDELKVETNQAEGFEAYPVSNMFAMSKDLATQFAPRYVDKEAYDSVYQKLLTLVN